MVRNRGFTTHHSVHGFTLLELLVVMAIMVGLMIVVIPQFNSFQRSQNLKNTALELQTNLRKAQNNAASGVKCNSTTSAASWNIEFPNSTSYQLETVCSDLTVSPAPPSAYSLPSGISVDSITLDSCSDINLIEVEADPRVIFSNISGAVGFSVDPSVGCPVSETSTKQMIITLMLDYDLSFVDVIIEKGGSIYVRSQ